MHSPSCGSLTNVLPTDPWEGEGMMWGAVGEMSSGCAAKDYGIIKFPEGFLCARQCPHILTHLNSKTREVGVIMAPTLQMGKLR